jgi:hypothetical protein
METKLNSHTGNFFEVVVKVLQTQEDGSEKKVREEVYAIEASSFTEAEALITEEMKPHKEYDIVNINPTPYKEVFLSDNANERTSLRLSWSLLLSMKRLKKKSEQRLSISFRLYQSRPHSII